VAESLFALSHARRGAGVEQRRKTLLNALLPGAQHSASFGIDEVHLATSQARDHLKGLPITLGRVVCHPPCTWNPVLGQQYRIGITILRSSA
jgi:hypothetical protein